MNDGKLMCDNGDRVQQEYLVPPNKGDKQKMRQIIINELDHGYVVNVGCKSFVIETKEKLNRLLIQYINSPQDMEDRYNKNEVFNDQK